MGEPETGDLVVAAGDYVRVDVEVTCAQTRYFVAVVDPLPAGLEAVDAELATTARVLVDRAISNAELHDDRAVFYADKLPAGSHHFSYLARATTPGVYHVGGASAEEMYSPEIFGRGAAIRVEVTAAAAP